MHDAESVATAYHQAPLKSSHSVLAQGATQYSVKLALSTVCMHMQQGLGLCWDATLSQECHAGMQAGVVQVKA